MITTTTDTAAQAAYHAQAATNGIATVAGHLARLRELAPAHDAALRALLADLGAISGAVRALGEEAGR